MALKPVYNIIRCVFYHCVVSTYLQNKNSSISSIPSGLSMTSDPLSIVSSSWHKFHDPTNGWSLSSHPIALLGHHAMPMYSNSGIECNNHSYNYSFAAEDSNQSASLLIKWTPGRCSNFKWEIFERMLQINFLNTSCKFALGWMWQNPYDMSTCLFRMEIYYFAMCIPGNGIKPIVHHICHNDLHHNKMRATRTCMASKTDKTIFVIINTTVVYIIGI